MNGTAAVHWVQDLVPVLTECYDSNYVRILILEPNSSSLLTQRSTAESDPEPVEFPSYVKNLLYFSPTLKPLCKIW
jgi:hypothetical protein